MKKKYLAVLAAGMLTLGVAGQASASHYLGAGTALTGGDATSMGVADVLLDIAFAIDTSGSMSDEGNGISNSMQNIIDNLDCPDCDVWVRASFFGINGTGWGIFGKALTATPVNHDEDNGPAVTALVANDSMWSNAADAAAGQDYYRAVVSIGDEGTENGYEPSGINKADWDAALVANQAAIADNVMIFSITGTPWSSYAWDEANRDAVFEAMAMGGSSGYGYTLGNTGGTFAKTTSETLEADIENIICTASQGGNEVPEPATMLLFGTGLTGLIASRRRKAKK